MKKIVVVGGGLAGLSAASFLANKFHVQLYEQSPKLGGRTYSFIDKESGDEIDNGQHLLLGCYKDTFEFSSLINAQQNFIFEESLKIPLASRSGKIDFLQATSAPYPFSLSFGILNFDLLSFIERLKILELMTKMFFSNYNADELNVEQWLNENGQTKNIRKYLWDILSIGALNCKPENASAEIFIRILREIFFTGGTSSKFVIPKFGLSQTFCSPAEKFIIENNGEIFLSNGLKKIEADNGTITNLHFDKILSDFDAVILALPSFAYKNIAGAEKLFEIPEIEHSPILTVHIWLKQNFLKEKYYALIDSPVHWVFNHDRFITIVISAANDLINKDESEIFSIIWKEVESCLQLRSEQLVRYKILKEKRATLVPSKENLKKRLQTKTNYENLFLAGDWIQTELPSTIESAVRSGKYAAEAVFEKFS